MSLSLYGIKKVFILGAGFSSPLGLPLTNGLLKEVFLAASKRPYYDESGIMEHGQGSWLIDELSFYFPTLEFNHDIIKNSQIPNNFDFEKFLSYAYANSCFGEQWDVHGDKFISFLKGWVGDAIYNSQIKCLNGKIPQQYIEFLSSIQNSLIITFNWDTVLEILMEANNINYSYDFKDLFQDDKPLCLLKMHGSIDWFKDTEKRKYDSISFKDLGGNYNKIYKGVGDLNNCYKQYLHPMIITPNYDKISQVLKLGKIWQYPWLLFRDIDEVVIIGFSLRPDDYHSRAVIYPQLVQGSRERNLRIKIIDYAKNDFDKKKIMSRYEGVNNCEYWFDGFNLDSIDFINS